MVGAYTRGMGAAACGFLPSGRERLYARINRRRENYQSKPT